MPDWLAASGRRKPRIHPVASEPYIHSIFANRELRILQCRGHGAAQRSSKLVPPQLPPPASLLTSKRVSRFAVGPMRINWSVLS